MSSPSAEARPRPRLIWLAVIILLLAGVIGGGMIWGNAKPSPELALDLQGGTQIILEPVVQEGETVTQEQLDEAVAIIRQRIDSTGVSEPEINTQGASNIVVNLPEFPDETTRELVRASAQLRFRPVIASQPAQAPEMPAEEEAEQPDLSEDGQEYLDDLFSDEGEQAPEGEDSPDAGGTVAAPQPQGDTGPVPGPAGGESGSDDPASAAPVADPSDPAQVSEELASEFVALDCSDPDARTEAINDDPEVPVAACSDDGLEKFVLGPMEVSGATISDASFGFETTPSGAQTNRPAVNLEFTREGAEQFFAVTQRITTLEPPRNQFAIVLDGVVISAPVSQAVISDGRAQISGGNITQESAQTLANQLRNGSLPISFEVQSEEQISPTLGAEYLRSALIAGAIGLALVIAYALLQYRSLGLLTVSSLGVVVLLTYLLLLLVSWRYGYRLSLAGMAGLIIGIGAAADSFIVYFERVRDEIRSGRGIRSAVEVGWERARRTIYASKAVNMLAAVILYFLAVGSVRGFAFTLGLTVIVDILVMVLFTHPMFQVIARTRFFGEGHPWSGMDPRKLGVSQASYRGALNLDVDRANRVGRRGAASGSAKEAARRQALVDRRHSRLDEEAGIVKDEQSGTSTRRSRRSTAKAGAASLGTSLAERKRAAATAEDAESPVDEAEEILAEDAESPAEDAAVEDSALEEESETPAPRRRSRRSASATKASGSSIAERKRARAQAAEPEVADSAAEASAERQAEAGRSARARAQADAAALRKDAKKRSTADDEEEA